MIFRYIVKKTAYGMLVLLGVLMVIFTFFHLMPGDPLIRLLGKRANDPVLRAMAMKEYGLDKPLYLQLLYYINDYSPISFHHDTPENRKDYEYHVLFSVGSGEEAVAMVAKAPYLRRSISKGNKKVSELMAECLEGTMWLAVSAMALATVMGLFLGVVAALNFNGFWDRAMLTISTLGISMPSFVMAILMAMVFGYYLSDYTGLPPYGYMWELDIENPQNRILHLERLVLPCITLGIRPMAIIAQLTRSAMLEILAKDFIRTARSKGLSEAKVIIKHALKNALNPVITAVSGWMASLMAGAFFVEYIFSWRGIGMAIISAVNDTDPPLIIGMTMLIATIFVVMNIMVDIAYTRLDPRVRLN
jgi:peptide/nickel transport system permease protein